MCRYTQASFKLAQLGSGQPCQCVPKVVTCPDCAATGPLLLMTVSASVSTFIPSILWIT